MSIGGKYFKYKSTVILIATTCIFSCQKKDIEFGNNALSQDPNIVTIDTISVQAFTFQVDSFSTLNTDYFIAGNYYDSVFGSFQSIAYFDVSIPYDSTGTLKNCTSCYFDSLVAISKFSGGYYGDTAKAFSLNVNQLTQTISNGNTFGYNTTSRNYSADVLGSFSGVISPSKENTIRIKLPDKMGNDLFNKIQSNSDTITESDLFLDYLKGFCFNANANNTVYYLKPVDDTNFIVLYYHKNAPLPQNYIVRFPLNSSHQFNGFSTDYSGTNLASFVSKKQQTVSAGETNGYVYLEANHGLYPKFNFPSLYSIKELNSYINVINATLEIYPATGSYGFQLPPALNAYIINEYGETQGYLTNSSDELQTGDLAIDYIYNKNTKYTYNVTSYVNSVLGQGKYSSLYLFLQPPSTAADSWEQRLVLNTLNNSSFKLKLNVLGL